MCDDIRDASETSSDRDTATEQDAWIVKTRFRCGHPECIVAIAYPGDTTNGSIAGVHRGTQDTLICRVVGNAQANVVGQVIVEVTEIKVVGDTKQVIDLVYLLVEQRFRRFTLNPSCCARIRATDISQLAPVLTVDDALVVAHDSVEKCWGRCALRDRGGRYRNSRSSHGVRDRLLRGCCGFGGSVRIGSKNNCVSECNNTQAHHTQHSVHDLRPLSHSCGVRQLRPKDMVSHARRRWRRAMWPNRLIEA